MIAPLTVRCVSTASVLPAGWCAMRRGCSPSATVRTCSFWMGSTVPMVSSPSEATAREWGKGAEWKEARNSTWLGDGEGV